MMKRMVINMTSITDFIGNEISSQKVRYYENEMSEANQQLQEKLSEIKEAITEIDNIINDISVSDKGDNIETVKNAIEELKNIKQSLESKTNTTIDTGNNNVTVARGKDLLTKSVIMGDDL